MNYTVAKTIHEQLGGNKFTVMTGSYNYVYGKDYLQMTLRRNMSKANRLKIVLNGLDLYDMYFIKHIEGGISLKTGKVRETKDTEIVSFKDIPCDALQEIFTRVTGFDTHL